MGIIKLETRSARDELTALRQIAREWEELCARAGSRYTGWSASAKPAYEADTEACIMQGRKAASALSELCGGLGRAIDAFSEADRSLAIQAEAMQETISAVAAGYADIGRFMRQIANPAAAATATWAADIYGGFFGGENGLLPGEIPEGHLALPPLDEE